MPRGQSGHTRIGTFACRSNPAAHPKQAKEPTFQPATKGRLNDRRLNDFKLKYTKLTTFRFRRQLGQREF